MHLAEDIVVEVTTHAGIVRFWHNPHAQDELRKDIIHTLDDRRPVSVLRAGRGR